MSKPSRSWRDALTEYARPRVVAMLFLGFSSGLPFLLVFSTLSAWLREAGIDRSTIGLMSWIGMTYSIKIFWAPVIDRLNLPLLTQILGRRRGWMLVAQIGLMLGLTGMAQMHPGTQLMPLIWMALLVAFSSATQDIVVDAWRIEAEPGRQGTMAAAYQLGYRIAILVTSAGALYLAGTYSWKFSYGVMAALVGIGLITTLLIPEPDPSEAAADPELAKMTQRFLDRHPTWPTPLRDLGGWFVTAVGGPFHDFFARNGLLVACLILAFVGTFRLTDITMGVMANPFYLDAGYTLQQIAAVAKGIGVFASFAGVLIGGFMVAALGVVRSLVVAAVLVMLSNLCFAWLALQPHPGLWQLGLVVSADNLAYNIAGTSFIAYLSGLTNTAYTATQYALFSSLFTLPGKILAGGSGFIVDAIGYPGFFVYSSLVGLPALIILLLLQHALKRRQIGATSHASINKS